jgi:hypothetical protein
MQRRSGLRRALFALLPVLAAAACTDKSPTIGGVDYFPGGERPTTLETVLPGTGIVRELGSFAGYPRPLEFPASLVVANKYQGVVDANALLHFAGFPTNVQFTQGSVKSDTLFTYGKGTLVAAVDSAASVFNAGPVDFTLYELGQSFNRATVTYTVASDTSGVRTLFTQPGGTRARVIARATWNPAAAGDSLVFAIDSATVARMAVDSLFPGLLIATDQPGTRVQLQRFVLRTGVHPASASPDTLVPQNIGTGDQTYVFNPEAPPRSSSVFEVGGIASARTLFHLDLSQQVSTCPAGGGTGCGTLPLTQVTLNEVALLLRPVAPPPGFAVLDSVALVLRGVEQPELGFRAPLGAELTPTRVVYHRGDTLVALPLTTLARLGVATDSLSGDYALLGQTDAGAFGVLWFEPTPRLRIIYTLPARPQLP